MTDRLRVLDETKLSLEQSVDTLTNELALSKVRTSEMLVEVQCNQTNDISHLTLDKKDKDTNDSDVIFQFLGLRCGKVAFSLIIIFFLGISMCLDLYYSNLHSYYDSYFLQSKPSIIPKYDIPINYFENIKPHNMKSMRFLKYVNKLDIQTKVSKPAEILVESGFKKELIPSVSLDTVNNRFKDSWSILKVNQNDLRIIGSQFPNACLAPILNPVKTKFWGVKFQPQNYLLSSVSCSECVNCDRWVIDKETFYTETVFMQLEASIGTTIKYYLSHNSNDGYYLVPQNAVQESSLVDVSLT
jgi:hypothetical protein